jgi:hypothetical protein
MREMTWKYGTTAGNRYGIVPRYRAQAWVPAHDFWRLKVPAAFN